jgi:hypothetical protein
MHPILEILAEFVNASIKQIISSDLRAIGQGNGP